MDVYLALVIVEEVVERGVQLAQIELVDHPADLVITTCLVLLVLSMGLQTVRLDLLPPGDHQLQPLQHTHHLHQHLDLLLHRQSLVALLETVGVSQ